jgi:hypothetical protein
MSDKNIITQYFNFIKQAGYKYSKDNLGYYFDNGLKRYSIMKTGPMFICYFNIKVNSGFVLKDKSNSTINFEDTLRWVLLKIQQDK